ncbi:MAG: CC/Se motif family (seleno)protein [Halofilum sp. (in: g-proteobacteria)]
MDAGARDWLRRHGGAVTLRASPRHGCCGGTAMLPVAEARRPDEPGRWLQREIDGLEVYIDPAIAEGRAETDLTIRAEGLARWRRLFVEASGAQS